MEMVSWQPNRALTRSSTTLARETYPPRKLSPLIERYLLGDDRGAAKPYGQSPNRGKDTPIVPNERNDPSHVPEKTCNVTLVLGENNAHVVIEPGSGTSSCKHE